METGLTFEQALTRLKSGHKIARKCWAWQAVELLESCQDIRIRHFSTAPCIAQSSISLGYSPDSEDMLATDWEVVE